ncbi:hypothetical protein LR48_Vigan09g060500 [Vigna angularis]|uniref:Major facilitator superfamily (MFS) profile domain-containing protein n=1 Tax=Phaseolus angularis TaxID=3914 RepID=A0A0L9VA64_PHAAN|nr:hypothetical protein LR48_Vigan09g060500 [Vigna angularis]
MAGGFIKSGSPYKNYPGKLTWRAFTTCFVAAFGGLIFGYDLGISGGVTSMDPFLKKFFPGVYQKENNIKHSDNQYCKFDNQILTLFTSSLYLAALIASLFASKITRLFGRRLTMLVGGVLFLIGAGCNAFAENVWMSLLVAYYLVLELDAPIKGELNMMFQLAITVGIFIANVLNYIFAKTKNGEGWRYNLGFAAVPAVMIIFDAFFLLDSPSSLIERGLDEKVKMELIKIRGTIDVEKEFDDLVAASESSKTVKHPWLSLLKRQYGPQLTFAITIPFF